MAVGPRSKMTAESAQHHGLSKSAILWFESAPEAVEPLKKMLGEKDTVLVKGSLGMGMARIVAALEIES